MVSARSDFFDKARGVSAITLLASGLTAAVGSVVTWVSIRTRDVVPGADFGRPIEAGQGQPFTGIEARDGWYVLGAATLMMLAAIALFVRQRGGWAWLGFVASVVVGAIAVADYRQIGNAASAISQRMDVGAEAAPGIGLILVAIGGVAGLISSVTGVAATPAKGSTREEIG